MGLFDFVPRRASILLIGPPRSGKNIFADQFVVDGLLNNESSIYMIANNFPEEVINRVLPLVNGKIENLRMIDCYTIHAGISKRDEKFVFRTSGPYALNEISIAITKALKECNPPTRTVIDSLTTLLLHNKMRELEEFLEVNIGKLKAKNSTVLFMVEEGVHTSRTISLLGSLTDATIKFDEDAITLTKTGEEQKIKYKLEKNKIIMG